MAKQAGELLKVIVPSVHRTAELIQQISSASNEQDIGARQISSSIEQLNQVIQQNAVGSEDVSTTAEALSVQADRLEQMLTYFRMETAEGGSELESINDAEASEFSNQSIEAASKQTMATLSAASA